MKFCNQHHPLSLPPFPIVEHKLSQRSSHFGGNFRVEEENCRLGWSWNPSKRSFDLCTRKKKPHLELMHPNKVINLYNYFISTPSLSFLPFMDFNLLQFENFPH